jgi:hypothetical protein
VIGVTVRHDYPCEAGAARVKMLMDRREMPRLADACIDERRFPARSDEQVCIVALPGHGAWVVRGKLDWHERHGDVRTNARNQ